MLFFFASLANLPALVPLPEGGYPGGNTAEGQSAPLSNSSGTQKTASGAFALFSNTQGSFNRATRAAALFSNTAVIGNTATALVRYRVTQSARRIYQTPGTRQLDSKHFLTALR